MKNKNFSVFFFIFALSILISESCFAQNPGEWMWVKGDSLCWSTANYGMQGVADPTNNPPGLYEACEWTDLNGNFWMFGGYGTGGDYNDLWKFDPIAKEWTWMKGPGLPNDTGSYGIQGISSPGNNPHCRAWGISSWTDLSGNLWMFGGLAVGPAGFNDLWMYNIAINEWVWMKGPNIVNQLGVYGIQGVPALSNNPVNRGECGTTWTDNSGALWLFGGQSGSCLNDLWKYNIPTNEWIWMKGSQLPGDPGNYGLQTVEDPANSPGARCSYSRWKDAFGNLWLFGGDNYLIGEFYNDLWKYNPATNNWTWMNGGNSIVQSSHGNQCTFSPLNYPGSRTENRASWTDPVGNFWLFGGSLGNNFFTIWNDLWMYCVSSNQWNWVSGDVLPRPLGNWGNMNVSSPSNMPDARCGAISWTDNNWHIYFFGGSTWFWCNPYNDIWEFTIDTTCGYCSSTITNFSCADNFLCPGTCTDFTNLSYNTTSYQWSFPGATTDTSTATNPLNICYPNPGIYDVQLIATNANGSDTLLLTNYITVYPSPPPQSITQSGDTLFAISGATSYQWYYNGNNINGATDYFYVAATSGDYNVVATDVNGCEVEAAVFNIIAEIGSGSGESAAGSINVVIFPNPVGKQFTIHSRWLSEVQCTIGTAVEISIYNMVGEKVLKVLKESGGKNQDVIVDVSELLPGMYWVEIFSGEKIFRCKFMKK
ncbi:MAG: kelch repeat-containing protein [Bacteroidota bacterium]